MKPRVTREFEILDGRWSPRGSMEDLSARTRVFRRMVDAIQEEGKTIVRGHAAYNQGLYEEALEYFTEAMEITPNIEEELYPHLLICRRIMGIPKDYQDGLYDESVRHWESSFLRRFRKSPPLEMRCKYCGHYTGYISPNEGWGWSGNQCRRCHREYPMPDFLWDSIDGQAYIYYRGSVAEPEFYLEFERIFDVEEPFDRS